MNLIMNVGQYLKPSMLRYIKGGEAGMISKKDIANMIRRRRKIGVDLPPVYPNGWFRLLDSGQIKNGEVKEVCALGRLLFVLSNQIFHYTRCITLKRVTNRVGLNLSFDFESAQN